MEKVQGRFEVEVPLLPSEIDVKTYSLLIRILLFCSVKFSPVKKFRNISHHNLESTVRYLSFATKVQAKLGLNGLTNHASRFELKSDEIRESIVQQHNSV